MWRTLSRCAIKWRPGRALAHPIGDWRPKDFRACIICPQRHLLPPIPVLSQTRYPLKATSEATIGIINLNNALFGQSLPRETDRALCKIIGVPLALAFASWPWRTRDGSPGSGAPDAGIAAAGLEAELLAKCVDQGHPREVHRLGFLEGDLQISRSFGHCTQSYLLGRVVRKRDNRRASAFLPSKRRSCQQPIQKQIAHQCRRVGCPLLEALRETLCPADGWPPESAFAGDAKVPPEGTSRLDRLYLAVGRALDTLIDAVCLKAA